MSKKLYKDIISTSGAIFITSIIGIITGILFPRLLGPEQWGLWSITRGVIGLLGPFAQLAMSTTLTTYISKYKKDKEKISSYVNSAYFVAIFSSFLVSLSLIFLSSYLASSVFGDDRLKIFLLIGSGIIFFQQLNNINKDYFRGFKDFKKYNLLKVIPRLSILLLSISFLILFSYRAIYLALSKILIFSILCTSVLIYLYRYEDVFQIFRIPQKDVTKKVLKFGVPLIFTITFMKIMKSMDRVLIGYFLEATNVGIYSVAAGIPLMIGAMFTPISTVLLPTFSERHEEGKSTKVLLGETFSLLLSLSIPLIIFLIFFGGEVIRLIWGHEYIGGAMVLSITSFEIFLFSSYRILGSPAAAAERTKSLAIGVGIAAITNIILNSILIPIIGIEGAAVGTVISFLILFFYMINLCKKEYGFDFENINIKMIGLLVLSLLGITPILIEFLVEGIISLIASGFVFLGIFWLVSHIFSPLWYKEMMNYLQNLLGIKVER